MDCYGFAHWGFYLDNSNQNQGLNFKLGDNHPADFIPNNDSRHFFDLKKRMLK